MIKNIYNCLSLFCRARNCPLKRKQYFDMDEATFAKVFRLDKTDSLQDKNNTKVWLLNSVKKEPEPIIIHQNAPITIKEEPLEPIEASRPTPYISINPGPLVSRLTEKTFSSEEDTYKMVEVGFAQLDNGYDSKTKDEDGSGSVEFDQGSTNGRDSTKKDKGDSGSVESVESDRGSTDSVDVALSADAIQQQVFTVVLPVEKDESQEPPPEDVSNLLHCPVDRNVENVGNNNVEGELQELKEEVPKQEDVGEVDVVDGGVERKEMHVEFIQVNREQAANAFSIPIQRAPILTEIKQEPVDIDAVEHVDLGAAIKEEREERRAHPADGHDSDEEESEYMVLAEWTDGKLEEVTSSDSTFIDQELYTECDAAGQEKKIMRKKMDKEYCK